MVYNEKAYREIFPEVKITKVVKKVPESMIEDPEEEKEVETETPEETSQEDELEVDAPDPVQEGGDNESGTDDTAD